MLVITFRLLKKINVLFKAKAERQGLIISEVAKLVVV